jgi:4a-hydroxytetrahydrobiopterin dehydratase
MLAESKTGRLILCENARMAAHMLTLEELASEMCVEQKGSPMTSSQARELLRVIPGWSLLDGSIEKEFRFESYLAGLDFAYAVGKVAEKVDHHPDILIRWRRVKLTLSTHSVKGLSKNDFIVAARVELTKRVPSPA